LIVVLNFTALAQRILEMLVLGPIDTGPGLVAVDEDQLANIGGEIKISQIEFGPEEGDEFETRNVRGQ